MSMARPPKIPYEKMTTMKFGKLTPVKCIGIVNGRTTWECLCDCGNTVNVIQKHLSSGNTKSCGCYQRDRAHETNFQDLTGQIFGKLTVIKRVENNRFDQVCYQCQCECGGIAIVPSQNLRKGITNSCGCIKSKGEMLVNKWLVEHQIDFYPQYSIKEIVLNSEFYDLCESYKRL